MFLRSFPSQFFIITLHERIPKTRFCSRYISLHSRVSNKLVTSNCFLCVEISYLQALKSNITDDIPEHPIFHLKYVFRWKNNPQESLFNLNIIILSAVTVVNYKSKILFWYLIIFHRLTTCSSWNNLIIRPLFFCWCRGISCTYFSSRSCTISYNHTWKDITLPAWFTCWFTVIQFAFFYKNFTSGAVIRIPSCSFNFWRSSP